MTSPSDHVLADLAAGRLAGATRLDLRGAGLRAFPREVFALADTLDVLDLSGNALSELPDDLPRLARLRVIFCSDNGFTTLPRVLGRCASLEMVGFKANAVAEVPEDALPPALRWLILTDNAVASLPASLVRCARLQKLMLAGNRLRALPDGFDALANLELLRLSANDFPTAAAALPDTLLALPRLAWLALGGNPFNAAAEARAHDGHLVAPVPWSALRVGELLGEGASGRIHAADWPQADGTSRAVAVKLFKGAVTSDGLPRSELAASVTVGTHAHLVGVEGQVEGHPDGTEALVLDRIPPGYRNLAGPPSFASCTRDVYPDDRRFRADAARAIADGMTDALGHLHARGLMHGDFYAHNILVDDAGHALLGDFGAASFVPDDDPRRAEALRAMDRRALAILVDELARRTNDAAALAGLAPQR